ncbi:Zinc/iron permease [Xylariaceae sp. FL1019]|nr:Zinc/iron permease [Xylariaceae sp. FL1019]
MSTMDDLEGHNDLRGWVMCIISGIACVLGASIICVDVFVRLFPGKKDFRIQDSNTFLACSLSLSFGVMLFMSLNSMLPEAKEYLSKAKFKDNIAQLILIACFVGGFVGIQILSRLFHQLLPSHVVDCDHSHSHSHEESRAHSTSHPGARRRSSRARSVERHNHSAHIEDDSAKLQMVEAAENGHADESTPLLPTQDHDQHSHSDAPPLKRAKTVQIAHQAQTLPKNRSRATTTTRRPSVMQMPQRVVSFVKDTKTNCDEAGPCYGYSDPCGQECFKHLTTRYGGASRATTFLRTNTNYAFGGMDRLEEHGENAEEGMSELMSPTERRSRTQSRASHPPVDDDCESVDPSDVEAQHHHHVAKNAFLSLGLQTSVAIALHKFPEGFITYATNHANPALGFNVFLALFVHNISEGFALALPLYMALGSRMKAILWSFFLGGLSQPLGALIAFAWFKVADRTSMTPDAVAYGCLFAATSGIMVSVALQLFVESLSLNHNQNLSILFAFLGMTLLGLSNAFTSDVH